MSTSKETEDIIYISVSKELERSIGDFQIDPDIMLPVEVTGGDDKWDIHDLSWEQIIAAMLKILAYDRDHEDAGYYRRFVLTVRPDIVDELTQTAIMKARNSDYELAEEIFLALIGLQPSAQRPMINLALLYEQRASEASKSGDEESVRSNVERTGDIYRKIMEADEVLPDAHLSAGHFFLNQHEYSQAREHLAAYQSSGDDEEKRDEAANIVKELDSQNLLDGLFKEAYDLIRTGREEDGIDRIRQFLESYPNVWNGWFLLGWGLRRLERFEEATRALDRALETGPRQSDTLNELAICSMELNDLGRARSLLIEALSGEPENTKIISNLGIVAMKTDEFEEAKAYFRAVLEISPADQAAQSYLDQLN